MRACLVARRDPRARDGAARRAQPALQDIIIAMPNFTFTSTPNFIAEELGLWAKHGLRVKIIQIAGVGATNAVIAGIGRFRAGRRLDA